MKCDFNMLEDYVEGFLKDIEQQKIEAHLHVCEKCQKEYKQLLKEQNNLIEHLKKTSMKNSQADAIMQRIQANTKHKRSWHSIKITVITAAVIMLAFVFYYLDRTPNELANSNDEPTKLIETNSRSEEVQEDKPILSPTFSIPVTFGDGTEGEYLFIGEEGKVAFLIGSGKTGEAVAEKIIANQVNKYMWQFWGDKDTLIGEFKVVGIDEEGNKHPVLLTGKDKVWKYENGMMSPLNGADNHIPTNMVFPTSGLWKLEIYFDDKLFGELVIKVEES